MDDQQPSSLPPDPAEPSVWEYLTQILRHDIKKWFSREAALANEPVFALEPEPRPAEIPPLAEPPPAEMTVPASTNVPYHVTTSTAGIAESLDGSAHVDLSVIVPRGTKLHITVSLEADAEEPSVVVQSGRSEAKGERDQRVELAYREASPASVARPLAGPGLITRLQSFLSPLQKTFSRLNIHWRWDLPTMLFGFAVIIYLITHLTGLLKYPIYFFSDEAMQPLFAEGLMREHFMDTRNNIWLPVYVEVDGNRWAPLLPMYLHAVTLTLFGKTAFVTRATSALFTLLAAISVSLILKQVFRSRFWWMGALLLLVTPAWFLHSRTAFETVIATTFYALFLWLYLLYRSGRPRMIFPAVLCAAAAFYSYSNAEVVLGITALLLLVSDAGYHWQQRRTLVWLIPLGLLLAMPLIIFEWRNPQAIGLHLRVVDSYWFHDISLAEKLKLFAATYSMGLSPLYWFFNNGQDLIRHRMGNIPHILTIFLPFFLIGVIVCVRQFRSAPHRVLLLAALAAPAGAAQLDVTVLRVMTFVIPAVLFISLGWEWLWQFLQRRFPRLLSQQAIVEKIAQWSMFYLLAFGSLFLLGNALNNGALWSPDYGLYGMQYGATQLFEDTIPSLLRENPEMQMLVTPTWANGTHRLADFMLSPDDRQRVQMGNIDAYLFRKLELPQNLLFIMTSIEFETVKTNPKLSPPVVVNILPYPDGSPGFYLVYWSYSPEADAIFAAEKAERMQLKEAEVTINDQLVRIRHSWIDIGSPQEMFDNDRFTLMRGMEANPLIVELTFPEAVNMSGITTDFGAQDTTITATLTLEGHPDPITFTQTYLDVGDPQELNLPFDGGPYQVTKLWLEFQAVRAGDFANIHVRELRLLP